MANNDQSDLIELAINQALTQYDDAEEGDVLVEWVVVAYVSNPDKEKGGGYPRFLSNGVLPQHRAIGLLQLALEELKWEHLLSSADSDE